MTNKLLVILVSTDSPTAMARIVDLFHRPSIPAQTSAAFCTNPTIIPNI